jgi:Tol biopolymer transport system component
VRTPPLNSLVFAVSALCVAGKGFAQVTERSSVGAGGVEANFYSDVPYPGCFVSADGRFVVFKSAASNLVVGDQNQTWDVFLRDRRSSTTELISIDSAGVQANSASGLYGTCISTNGRYVVYYSPASNLVAGDTNGWGDIFLRDRELGTTERVSLGIGGAQANDYSAYPSISEDGRFVAFESRATNLVPGDTNGTWDVFVRDRQNGTTELVSVDSSGTLGNDYSGGGASISASGRHVSFVSFASNLTANDTNATWDAFVHDRLTGLTERASIDSSGAQGNDITGTVCISSSGRFAAMTSDATNLVPGDTNARTDVFVRDLLTQTTERVSVATNGAQGDGNSQIPTISSDGRFVSFVSGASNLVAGDTNGYDVFVRDQQSGTTERVSVTTAGGQAIGSHAMASISAEGRYVVFRSDAIDLVSGDTNGAVDIFLHDRASAGFGSLCDPGQNNVIACPCGNPPSGIGRGCDNSSFTGGASILATGLAYLSIDSLAFTSSDEKPTATSILLQGDALLANGLVFGQGVRCMGGSLKRMFTKVAAGGSITAPDFGAGDPTISARSAALGAPIQPGIPRYFLVYYRDPVVLGTCPNLSTFNASQTGRVTYWP